MPDQLGQGAINKETDMIRKYDARPDKLGRVRLQIPGRPLPVFAKLVGTAGNVAGQGFEIFSAEPQLCVVKYIVAGSVKVTEELVPQTYVVMLSEPLASLNGNAWRMPKRPAPQKSSRRAA